MQPDKIIEGVRSISGSAIVNRILQENPDARGKNEFLFFIKPELLLDDPAIQTKSVLSIVLEKIGEFGLDIASVRVLSAGYLEKHRIIAQHYGVINQIASDARSNVSEAGKKRFQELFGEDFDSATVLGGLEFLKVHPCFSSQALDYLWQNRKFDKLAGGTYALRLSLDGDPVYLVNGFHARQLEHFTQPGRSIVVFSLRGDINWQDARTRFIGATCPADAAEGSIRRVLLENAGSYGLKAVTPSWNGVHLSAGPIEGLIELIRYQSDYESDKALTAADFRFGQQLIEAFGQEKTDWLLTNPTVEYEGEAVSVFDLTEEKNSEACIDMLQSIR